MRLHHNNIYRDSGIDIPEAWMPTKKKQKKMTTDLTLPLPRRTAGGSVSSSHNANNALARNPPTMSEV